MKVEVRAEYACGHPPRVVSAGEVKRETLSADLRRIVYAAVGGDGCVGFNCLCGRGAAFVEIVLDGQIIDRRPAVAFLGTPGARLTLRKREDGAQ